jgi:uncharacterized protein (DUF1800 family)
MQIRMLILAASTAALLSGSLRASDPPPPQIIGVGSSNAQKTVVWAPYPAANGYSIQSKTNVAGVFTNDNQAAISGFSWRTNSANPSKFFRLGVTPMSSNALLTANVLNRIAYGPTPDELERILTGPTPIGPQAYINEQLAMEGINETSDAFVVVNTNGVNPPAPTNWIFVSLTGRATGTTRTNIYVYLTQIGDGYIDDLQLYAPTNTTFTGNLIRNGDFELPLTNGWTVPANMTNSSSDTSIAHSGSSSLHIVSTSLGNQSLGSVITQPIATTNVLADGEQVVLSFWYLPGPNSRFITIRLSGNGLEGTGGSTPTTTANWIYATATGTATATPTLYVYLGGASEAYIDDIKLVSGTVPEAGPNLLQNGDFESPLGPPWTMTTNFTNSAISGALSHSGAGSLRVIATAAGSGNGNAILQTNIPGVVNNQTYTVSFWYTVPTRGQSITVRLSGPGLTATPESSLSLANIRRRLDSIDTPAFGSDRLTIDAVGGLNLADLRSWFVQNAVGSKRQLLEVLSQFLENHFVTEHSKSFDYLDNFYDGGIIEVLATDWEYREHKKWRNALLNPACSFYDLLKISAESPAMIVFLDTVNSRGDARNIANENYARELFELFCMGVDNGYDQNDIVAQSRAWTGWSVDIVDRQNIDNPLAPPSTTFGFYPGNGTGGKSNVVGVWAFNYKAAAHGTNRAPLFPGKTIPSRFGPPWAGQPYQLNIPRRITGDTNSIQDGYDVIRYLANLPFTMEFISVKLCRLFVHENFVHGVYNYADPNRPPEAELIRQCMVAWDGGSPKGQIRSVLNTIFNSDLFRSHGGSMQKVRTPLEFAVGTIRALRSSTGTGTLTANTDGYSISGRSRTASSAPLTRMGSMMLFDRSAPDGYAEAGSPWISSGTLAERIRFVQTTLMSTTDTNKADGINGGNNNVADPVALLKSKVAAGLWNNSGAVADYFLSILYPGEGKANLDLYRQAAIGFLETDDAGNPSSFATLGNTTTGYDLRMRGMVSMLMTLQRFQEQ